MEKEQDEHGCAFCQLFGGKWRDTTLRHLDTRSGDCLRRRRETALQHRYNATSTATARRRARTTAGSNPDYGLVPLF